MGKDSFDDIAGFLLGDKDNDKVVDFLDCQPSNPAKQDSGLSLGEKAAIEQHAKETVGELPKRSAVKDTDSDGVADPLDCQPTNPRRQDKNWFSGKALGSYGYDVDDSTAKRRQALKKCIRDVGAMKCWQKIHGIYVTWKNQSGYSQDDIDAVRRDRNWISKNYEMHRK